MRDRPTGHRGRLRAVRRHPVARLCAVLALLAHAVVGLSPLWVPAVERGGFEICTANGIVILPADPSSPGETPDQRDSKTDCPLCRIHADAPLPAAEQAVQAVAFAEPAFAPPGSSRHIAGRPAGFNRLVRAPPLLS
jgi:hypothetical protein